VSTAYLARASVVLACADSAATVGSLAAELSGRTTAPIVLVRTKSDLCAPGAAELETERQTLGAANAIAVSAESGDGLSSLVTTITTIVSSDAIVLEHDAPILTHERHRYGIQRALGEVRAFSDRWRTGDVPAVIAAVHLRDAVRALEELVGRVDVEDILDEVFRRFCVGK
jgi:tRNA modification GTPase